MKPSRKPSRTRRGLVVSVAATHPKSRRDDAQLLRQCESTTHANTFARPPANFNYATALGYKAGLSRNDIRLLEEIDRRTRAGIVSTDAILSIKEFDDTVAIDAKLSGLTDQMDKEIREKNTAEQIDARADEMYLSPPDNEEDFGALGERHGVRSQGPVAQMPFAVVA